MDVNRLCMGCMKEMEESDSFCPHCGQKRGEANTARALQPQTILNGKYLVGKVIGEGGFGITYLAYDLNLERRIAIKEYFPNEHAARDTSVSTQTALKVLTDGDEEQYKKGLERFSREAANLAKFSGLPGIVSIKETFYENNTAYMVMEYIEGVTLEKYLEDHGGRLPYAEVIGMMKPVMEDLEKIHKAGIIHRDISPDNIMVCNDGSVKLIDFGAARFVGNNDRKSLTIVLKHGYAPEEQYRSDGDQGPWTDVYALAATMYRMITGIVPQESTDRILGGDKVVPINKLVKELPKRVSDAIMHGMRIRASGRTKTMTAYGLELSGERGKKKWLIAAALAAGFMVAVCIGIIVFMPRKSKPLPEGEADRDKMLPADTEEKVSQSTEENDDGEEEDTEEEVSEYTAYRDYFDKNITISKDSDYYVYFFDVDHDDVDNMIVVSRVDYGKYEIYIYKYLNEQVEEIASYYREAGRSSMYVLPIDGSYYLATEDLILHDHSAATIEYKFFSLDGEGKMVLYSMQEGSYFDKEANASELLGRSIRLNSVNLFMKYDSGTKGGVNVSYNHDYRRAFDNIDQNKEYERWIWEHAHNEYGNLSCMAAVDLEKNGEITKIASYEESVPTEASYDAEYNVSILAYDTEEKVIDTVSRTVLDYYTVGISVVQFGGTTGLMVGADWDPQGACNFYRKLFVKYDNEFVPYTEMKAQDDSDYFSPVHGDLCTDADGNVYVNVWGDIETAQDPWMDSHFYIFFLDGEFYEYDSVPIELEQLSCFDNYPEILDEIKADCEERYGIWGVIGDVKEIEIRILDVMYSSNDVIYINYEVATKEYDNFLNKITDGTYLLCAILEIQGNSLEYVGVQGSRRHLVSGENFKSYIREFDYE